MGQQLPQAIPPVGQFPPLLLSGLAGGDYLFQFGRSDVPFAEPAVDAGEVVGVGAVQLAVGAAAVRPTTADPLPADVIAFSFPVMTTTATQSIEYLLREVIRDVVQG